MKFNHWKKESDKQLLEYVAGDRPDTIRHQTALYLIAKRRSRHHAAMIVIVTLVAELLRLLLS